MEVNEFQQKCLRTANIDKFTVDENIKNFSMGLCSEAGELVGMLKQHFYQGHEFDLENFKEEIGDMFWYVSNLCSTKGILLSDCMIGNIEKLQKRYPDGFTPADSIARVDVAKEDDKRPCDGCDSLDNCLKQNIGCDEKRLYDINMLTKYKKEQ